MNMLQKMKCRLNIEMLSIAVAVAMTLVGCGKDEDNGATPAPGGAVGGVDPSVEVAPEDVVADGLPGETQTDTMTYPAGASESATLTVERITPTKRSAGRAFTYEIRLTNTSGEPMNAVAVRETLPATFTVQRTDPAAAPTPATADPSQPHVLQWTVDVPAGGTALIQITGVAEQPGALNRTLAVGSGGSSAELPGAVDIAPPVVLVTREGPARVELCDPITYKYAVTNTGDGDTGAFQVTETLPAGLTTEQGGGAVSFDLGSLAKGERKEFVVQLKSAKPGEFTGKAVAKGSFGELASKPLTTVVVSPKLGLDIKAPVWEEVGSPVMYQVTVRNDGDAPARDVSLTFQSTGIQGAQLVTGPDMDTPAPPTATAPQVIGTIEPKTNRVISYTLRPPTKGALTVNVAATAKCGQQAAATPASAQPPAPPEPYRAAGQAQTSIVGVPASALEVADQDDPVAPGGEINYRIAVQNYGSANDRDVALVVTLPEGVILATNGVQGPSQAKVEGQKLTFPAIAMLAPGQPQQWTIKAVAPAQAGQKRIRAELRSATLIAPIVQTETTRVATPTP